MNSYEQININTNRCKQLKENAMSNIDYKPDTYMSQPKNDSSGGKLTKEEHREFYIRGDVCYVKVTTRNFYGKDDYQDSHSTEIIGKMNHE